MKIMYNSNENKIGCHKISRRSAALSSLVLKNFNNGDRITTVLQLAIRFTVKFFFYLGKKARNMYRTQGLSPFWVRIVNTVRTQNCLSPCGTAVSLYVMKAFSL